VKKIIAIFIVSVSLLATNANAQVSNLKNSDYITLSVDTVTNAGISYLKSGAISSKLGVLAVQVTATKISGTVGGTISLEYSLDGTNWSALSSTTHTATDVSSQTFGWQLSDGVLAKYIRVKWVGTGTMSASFIAKSWGQ
jgi:hypothetical protein